MNEHWPFRAKPAFISYENARASVAVLGRAGVTILAGTDANSDPNSPAQVPHGVSLHDELALLVEAGLTPSAALRAATSSAAAFFGLTDRGSLPPGNTADILMVQGDPTVDIQATQHVSGVWIAGVPAPRPEDRAVEQPKVP